MQKKLLEGLDISKINTPAYVLETEKLEENLRTLKRVEEESGAKILLALKGFSMYSAFPIVKNTSGARLRAA